jgi:hypothetical protein
VFDKFPKYHMKILLGDFNAKVGREDIFKPTIGNCFQLFRCLNSMGGIKCKEIELSRPTIGSPRGRM